jgi:hypothetical protein
VQTRTQNKDSNRRLNSEAGVTIIEMVISMLIVTIGLLALAGAIGYAMMVSNKGRNVSNTKLLVVSMLEQVETLRNTRQLTFGQIANTGGVDNTGASREFGGFPTSFISVTSEPGLDGIFGTLDDPIASATPYSRQVLITNLNPNLKRIQVTLRYADAGGKMQDLRGVSYLNNDTRSNFR